MTEKGRGFDPGCIVRQGERMKSHFRCQVVFVSIIDRGLSEALFCACADLTNSGYIIEYGGKMV